MRLFHPFVVVLPAVAALSACAALDGRAPAAGPMTKARPSTVAAEACDALTARLKYPGLRIESVSMVAAGAFAQDKVTTASPAHCLVKGGLNRRTSAVDGMVYEIGFEMRLPLAWNGRFFHQVNGGIDGVVHPAIGRLPGGGAVDSALNRGFAVLSSDAGHTGKQNPWFGLDPQARLDYGYNAVGTLTPFAKGVIEATYGRGPDRSYIGGCSNGGRHSMVAASRFADQYDGFLVGNPGFNLPKAAMAQMLGAQQYAKAARPGKDGKPDLATAVAPEQFGLLSQRILARCDALDGLADGIVGDTAACQRAFSLRRDVPVCTGGRGAQCLEKAQVDAIDAVMSGARNARNEPVYASFPYDPGIAGENWAFWEFVASQRLDPAGSLIFITPPLSADAFKKTGGLGIALGIDVERDVPKIHGTNATYPVSPMGFMTPPDAERLETLHARGARMMVYHGVADAVFSVNDTIRWYETLDANHRGRAAEFVRLYPVPGMNHCRGGLAADQFEMLDELVAWVEEGRAPARIVAKVRGPGSNDVNKELPADWPATRTRALCPYPGVARYDGRGNPESADSFRCTSPSK
ncbi:MAG: tannase/feruloyl esterase family alpha/beta hydrolase [Lautropia sp.]